jgi:hypothetical protein
MIDSNDALYARLGVWQDRNHNGISEASELADLPKMGIKALSLDYSVSALRDEHGNSLLYRAEVRGMQGARVGPFAYDVFLVAGPAAAPSTLVDPQAFDITYYECRASCESRLLPNGDPKTCDTVGRIAKIGVSVVSAEFACIEAKASCTKAAQKGDCNLEPGSLIIPNDPCKIKTVRTDPPSCQ